MSNGVIDQLFAKDVQDIHLNGKSVDNIATGRFNLFWNQPTLIANTTNNRGQLLGTKDNSNLSFVPNTNYDYTQVPNSNTVEGDNFMKINQISNKTQPVAIYNKISNKYQIPDIAAEGTGAGGYRLNKEIVNPVLNPNIPSYVDLDGKIIYPQSYVADPHFLPNPDIMYNIPVMGNVV